MHSSFRRATGRLDARCHRSTRLPRRPAWRRPIRSCRDTGRRVRQPAPRGGVRRRRSAPPREVPVPPARTCRSRPPRPVRTEPHRRPEVCGARRFASGFLAGYRLPGATLRRRPGEREKKRVHQRPEWPRHGLCAPTRHPSPDPLLLHVPWIVRPEGRRPGDVPGCRLATRGSVGLPSPEARADGDPRQRNPRLLQHPVRFPAGPPGRVRGHRRSPRHRPCCSRGTPPEPPGRRTGGRRRAASCQASERTPASRPWRGTGRPISAS